MPNFADANLSFEARLIGSLDHVPRAADVVASLSLNLEAPPLQKAALFAELARQIDIDPAASPGPGAIDAALPQGRDAELSRRRRHAAS